MKKVIAIILFVVAAAIAQNYNLQKSDNNFLFAVSTDGPWKDSMVPAAGFKVGASAPAWGNFTDANIQVLRFEKAADNLVHGSVQINHDYRQGTDVIPHVHVWYPVYAASGADTNVWKLTYSWGNISTNGWPTSTSISVTNTGVIQPNEHRVISFGSISGSGKTISSIFAVTVERTGSDGHDVYDDVIGFLGFDLHYQVDSLGSTQSISK